MAAKRSQRLKRVAEHFAEDQDRASRTLAERRAAVNEAEQRLDELRGYLDGYYLELDQVRRAGSNSVQLGNFNAFLGQVQTAITQQEQQLTRTREAYDQQMQIWFAARTQVRAVDQAADRSASVEQKALERSEQRVLDDLTLNRFLERRK